MYYVCPSLVWFSREGCACVKGVDIGQGFGEACVELRGSVGCVGAELQLGGEFHWMGWMVLVYSCICSISGLLRVVGLLVC